MYILRYFLKVSKASTRKRWNGVQRRIGITGGIASGKSTIAKYLEETKNIPILDADIYSRKALEPGTNAYHKVIHRYGNIVLDQRKKNDEIDRLELSKIIFNTKCEKQWLEAIIHPIVKDEFLKELNKEQKAETVGLIIPLLFEANLSYLCSEIWFVYCKVAQQYERLMLRNQLSYDQAKARIESQIPIEEKKDFADKIIDNSNKVSQSYAELEALL